MSVVNILTEYDLENKDKFLSLKDSSETSREPLEAVVKILTAYKEKISKEDLNLLAVDLGIEVVKTEPKKESILKADGSLDLSSIPEPLRPSVEFFYKEAQERKAEKEKIEKALEVEKNLRIQKEYISKAEKEFASIPGSAEEKGLILKELADKDQALSTKVELIFKSVEAILSKNNTITTQIGENKPTETSSSAWEKITSLAKEMVTKSEASSVAEGISVVIAKNPDLYKTYLSERA